MEKRVLITVGGTGGHVFPSVALAEHLKRLSPKLEVLFVGGNLDNNRFFKSHSFPYKGVSCSSIAVKKPLKTLAGFGKIGLGYLQSKHIINSFKPDLVVGFGSYYTFPTLLAAKWTGVPILLHESNSIPGKVNKLLSRYASKTAIQFPQTARHLKGESLVVKTPLRDGFYLGSASKEEARAFFGLEPQKPTLLVFGGSQGAKKINYSFIEALLEQVVPFHSSLQVIHLTGDPGLTKEFKALYEIAHLNAVVKDFEPSMQMAWQAADLSVCRSGAGTIAEELEFEVPAILIPYPYAAENHQELNADFLADQVKGAVKILERDLTSVRLGEEMKRLLSNDGHVLTEMKQAIKTYKQEASLLDLATLVLDMIEGKKT